MKIESIKEKEIWENFLLKCQAKTFLNSWNWGEFQKKLGHKAWRFGVYKKNSKTNSQSSKLIRTALVVKIEAKRGTFLFVPHGPNLGEDILKQKKESLKLKGKILYTLLVRLKKLARQEGASFIRFAPIWERNRQNIKIFNDLNFRQAPLHVHPEVTWEMDLTPTEKDILMNMRKNTRYEIRKGGRTDGLKIIKSDQIEQVKVFNDLYEKTAKRHDFVPFNLDYLQKEHQSFSSDDQILTFHAQYKGEIVSSAIIVFWQNQAFYHHGASTMKHRKIPSSHLLQWEVIKEAKNRDCKAYNFWGIADIPMKKLKKQPHPWKGITIFKRGFGGYREEYVKTQDLVICFKYWLNYLVETARKYKRHY